jgi:hypothetical protein
MTITDIKLIAIMERTNLCAKERIFMPIIFAFQYKKIEYKKEERIKQAKKSIVNLNLTDVL